MASGSIDFVALHYAMAALGNENSDSGEQTGHASQWYVSLEAAGTPYPGAVNGDLILYENGDVYKVENDIPVDTNINIGNDTATNPYAYALSIGFQGTKDEFDMRFLGALRCGSTNTILDGGKTTQKMPNVIVSGGNTDSNNADLLVDGSTSHKL